LVFYSPIHVRLQNQNGAVYGARFDRLNVFFSVENLPDTHEPNSFIKAILNAKVHAIEYVPPPNDNETEDDATRIYLLGRKKKNIENNHIPIHQLANA